MKGKYAHRGEARRIDEAMEALYSAQWPLVVERDKRYALIAFAETGVQQCAIEASCCSSHQMLYRWQREHKAFAEAWEEVRQSRLGYYEDRTAERAEAGAEDPWSGKATEIMLERLDPSHYGKHRIEHTGAVPTRVEIVED